MQVSDEVIRKIKANVSFKSDDDIAQFVADAINTYVALGTRVAAGDMLALLMKDGTDCRVVLPCFAPKPSEKVKA